MQKIFSRLNVTVAILLLQLVLTILFLDFIIRYFHVVFIFTYFLNYIIIRRILKKDEALAYKSSWIILILLFPLSGIIIYFLIENPFQKNKYIKHKLEREREKSAQLLAGYDFEKVDSRLDGISKYISEVIGYPVYRNTDVRYYSLGQYMFEDMVHDISHAKRYIFLNYYIVAAGEMWSKLEQLLIKKASEGLDVRLIFDDLGSASLFTNDYKEFLKSKNIKIVIFNKINIIFSTFDNNRTHRKILVIDGRIAYNGGINLTDEYINLNNGNKLWKDTGTRLHGESAISFLLMCIEVWNTFCDESEIIADYNFYKFKEHFVSKRCGLVLPYEDNPIEKERIGENVYIDILNKAEDYVYIFTPFLIISEYMIYAMKMAKKRGVDVRIITPGIPDWKTKSSFFVQTLNKNYYKPLQEVGIKIYEYPNTFVHAKVFVSDDEIAVVGTINLDYRSLYMNFECATLFYKGSIIQEVKKDWIDSMEKSIEVVGDDLTPMKRLLNRFLLLFAGLM